jgi:hypothetical protein
MNDRTKPVGFIGKDILAVEKGIIPDSKAYRAGVASEFLKAVETLQTALVRESGRL